MQERESFDRLKQSIEKKGTAYEQSMNTAVVYCRRSLSLLWDSLAKENQALVGNFEARAEFIASSSPGHHLEGSKFDLKDRSRMSFGISEGEAVERGTDSFALKPPYIFRASTFLPGSFDPRFRVGSSVSQTIVAENILRAFSVYIKNKEGAGVLVSMGVGTEIEPKAFGTEAFTRSVSRAQTIFKDREEVVKALIELTQIVTEHQSALSLEEIREKQT
jgi:hypothetical protein